MSTRYPLPVTWQQRYGYGQAPLPSQVDDGVSLCSGQRSVPERSPAWIIAAMDLAICPPSLESRDMMLRFPKGSAGLISTNGQVKFMLNSVLHPLKPLRRLPLYCPRPPMQVCRSAGLQGKFGSAQLRSSAWRAPTVQKPHPVPDQPDAVDLDTEGGPCPCGCAAITDHSRHLGVGPITVGSTKPHLATKPPTSQQRMREVSGGHDQLSSIARRESFQPLQKRSVFVQS